MVTVTSRFERVGTTPCGTMPQRESSSQERGVGGGHFFFLALDVFRTEREREVFRRCIPNGSTWTYANGTAKLQ